MAAAASPAAPVTRGGPHGSAQSSQHEEGIAEAKRVVISEMF